MCACVPPFPDPRRVSPTWDGPPARLQRDHRWVGAGGLAAGGLAGSCVHAAPHGAPAAQAAGGTLEGLHAAVPLHVQVLETPALPALPKLHLDLPWEKEGNRSHHATNCPQNGPVITLAGRGKIHCIILRDTSQGLWAPKLISQ